MSRKRHSSNFPVKIVVITLSYFLTLFLGGIPLTIVLAMDQTLLVRVLIASSGIVWAVVTIWFIWYRTDYTTLCRQWLHGRRRRKMQQDISRLRPAYPEYYALYKRYPHSIHRHERHCMHHDIPFDEMIESALQISEEEWAAREQFRTEF